jgi:hypothetical protein
MRNTGFPVVGLGLLIPAVQEDPQLALGAASRHSRTPAQLVSRRVAEGDLSESPLPQKLVPESLSVRSDILEKNELHGAVRRRGKDPGMDYPHPHLPLAHAVLGS